MATQAEIMQAIRNADAAGDSESVRKLGSYLQTMKRPAMAPEPEYNPTDGMSGVEKFLAGAGKSFVDIGRGVRQIVGAASQEEIDEAKRLDAPLMNTSAGTAGNIGGAVAMTLPFMRLPGANTAAGSGLTGAALGALQPVATGESRAANTALGGASGIGGVVLARGAVAGFKGAKALAEPLSNSGRQAIAGRTLQRFGVEATDLAGTTSAPTVTGARTTLAEQIARPEGAAGAARLQDAMRAVDPEIGAKFAAREIENNAARVGTLRDLAGESGGREFAAANRAGTAGPMYDDAFKVDPGAKLTPALQREMQSLLKSPAINEAAKAARVNAANAGKNVRPVNGSGSIEGLHNVKLALDDAIAAAKGGSGSAAQAVKADALKAAQQRLVSFMEKVSPDYGTARQTYAAMSKPLNQMDVAGEVLKRGTAANSDLAGNPRLMPNMVGNVMKDEAKLIKSATGRPVASKLADLLEPDQLDKLTAVAKELDRAAAVGRAGNGPGSATAQRLASQNVLRQLLGPVGLPESWAESTLLNTAMRPVQFAYNGVAEPKIQSTLAELLLDPDKAAKAIQAANPTQKTQLLKVLNNPALQQAARAALPAATVTGQ